MTPETLAAIKAHAAECYPRESCGLVQVVRGKERYTPCRNIAAQAEHFLLDPVDYAAAEARGEITAIVHSHCNLPPHPSQADRVGIERSGKPWIIVAWPTGEISETLPSGYRAPLIGREFHHGVLDCYQLIKDYYAETLAIDLPDPVREYEWWLKGQNLYLDNYLAAGFEKVDPAEMRAHDVLLMQVASPVPNHGAVYIGDNQIIQHVMHRLSSRDVYGGWYRKCTVAVLRHRSLM
jgi:proteasome lid subunit RPN8/RPN11